MRQQAEEMVRQQRLAPQDISALSMDGVRAVVHELQVHQIELEMQNEELRQTKERLTALWEKYADLYDFAPIGYLVLGEKDRVVEANLYSTKLLGVDRNTLLKSHLYDFIVDEDQDIYYLMRRKLAVARSKACELRMKGGSGGEFFARLECIEEPHGNAQHAQLRVAINDISARKQAERASQTAHEDLERRVAERTAELEREIGERKQVEHSLQESGLRLAGILDIVYDAIISVGEDQRILLFNQGAERIFGYARGEVVGRPLEILLPRSVRDMHRRHIAQFGQSADWARAMGNRREIVGRRKNGEEFPAEASFAQLRLRDEKIHTVTLRDLTEPKRLERERIDLERWRARGEMVEGLNHNLNNLIQGIFAPAEMLCATAGNEKDRRRAELIVHSAQRATDLVAQLNRGFRGDHLLPEPVDLGDIVREALQMTQSHRPPDIHIEVDIPAEGLPPIRGTASEVHSMAINLILNAFHAMPAGGVLTLLARRAQDEVQLTVRDTGSGMDSRTQEQIFEPFFTTKGDVGSGLGLFMVHAAIAQWGGRIEVESALGQGAVFVLHFPLWTERRAAPVAVAIGPAVAHHNKILLVEDDAPLRQILCEHLADRFEVEAFASGLQAVAAFVPGRYGVALIDLSLPNMPGDELAEKLRRADPQLATIMLTGFRLDAADPRLAFFNGYCEKPFSLGQLDEVVERVIALGAARRARRATD